MSKTVTNISTLKINYLSQADYDAEVAGGTIEPNELYLTPASHGGGASAFVAEFNVTTYADVKDAYDNDAILICTADDSGNTMIFQLAYYDDANGIFYFAEANDDGWALASIGSDDTWDEGHFLFASTDVATQLADGLMSALDKQKLDGLSKRNIWYGTCSTGASSSPKVVTTASGDFSLTNGSMLVVKFSNTNSLSSASLQVDGGTSKSVYQLDGTSDIANRWGGGEVVMFAYDGTKFILLDQSTASTTAYGITKLNNTVTSTSTSEAATANAVKSAYDHGGVTSVNGSTGAVTVTVPTITDTYNGTSSDGMSGKAVKSAIDALDGTVSGSAGSGKTLTAFSQTDGKVSATFGNISITKSQVSDFPTIPTNVSDLNNDSGFTATSITRHTTTGTNIADLTIDGTTTKLYAPTGGGGGITDVTVDGTSVVSGTTAAIDLTGKSDVGHTHTKSAITDFPTIPTITDTYSGTSSDGMSGKAVKSAIDALDGTVSGTAGSGKTLTAFSQTDGKVSATFGNISITKSQISDFPTIPTVNNATLTIQKNGTNVATFTANASSNVTANISVPTDTGDLTNGAGFITSYTETDPIFTASAAYGISSSDITAWNGKSNFSGDYTDLTNKPTIPTDTSDLTNGAGYLTSSGAVTSFNGSTGAVTYTAPVTSVNGSTGAVTISVPTITDTYSGTSSDGMSGKAVKSAIDALDGTISGSAGSSKTLTAFSQTDGKVSATFGNISITKSQVSDFPTIPSTAADVGAVPTSRTVNSKALSSDITLDTGDLTNGAGFITSSSESLATGITIYRIGSLRILDFNGATGSTISGITVASSDRPSEDIRATAIRRDSNASGTQLGMLVLRYSTGKVDAYRASTYGSSVTAIGTTDTEIGQLIWSV